MAENREYRSDVFSMLMEDKNNALQVYNALNGSSYADPEQVEIVSLRSGISLSIRNDAAFIVDMNLNIYEHQSSYNPNMPIRSLVYFAEYLREMIKNKDLLGSRLIKIPTPHFAVFYNGPADRPEREVLRLSASYEKPTDKPELELICTMYNINPDKDREMLSKCRVLYEYTQFVETVRRFEEEDPETSVHKSVDYCISHHILEEFLQDHRAEVEKAMTIDMTFERREVLIREEERAEGREEGRVEGRAEGRAESIRNLMKNMNLTADQAMQALGIPEEERSKYDELLKLL
ncbi:MAG: hypothetical protein K6F87_02265 [Lachnospiraceae bacterium]|nr:hypothetical protein [Lachnospiraceae bacterium]